MPPPWSSATVEQHLLLDMDMQYAVSLRALLAAMQL